MTIQSLIDAVDSAKPVDFSPTQKPSIKSIRDNFAALKSATQGLLDLVLAASGNSLDTPVLLGLTVEHLINFMVRYTDSGGRQLVTFEYLVKNNLHIEIGRGGYLDAGAATSEGQALMIKAYAKLHRITGKTAYLIEAKRYFNAFIIYFAAGVEPPASGAWLHHWLVNGGPDFLTKGPASAYGSGFDGLVNEAVAFTGGVGVVSSDLANVYKVFSGRLKWKNVFSPLTSGVEFTILSYVDKYKYVHTSNGSTYDAVAIPGTITLTTSTTDTLKVNFSIYTTTIIAHADPYEAWPMWRVKSGSEFAMAPDAIHWLIEAADLLIAAEPAETRWQYAKARLLELYDAAGTVDLNTYIFKKALGAYDKFPLTYYYRIFDDNSAASAPEAGFRPSRDGSNYCLFPLPPESSRNYFVLENGSLFIDYTGISSIAIDVISENRSLALAAFITLADGYEKYLLLSGAGVNDAYSIPIEQFYNWTGVGVWRITDGGYTYSWAGDVYEGSISYDTVVFAGANIAVKKIEFPFNTLTYGGGFGFNVADVSAFTTNNPPVIRYKASASLTLTVIDADDWRWSVNMAVQTSLATHSYVWSEFAISSYQTNVGTPPALPNDSAPIKTIQFSNDSGVVGLRTVYFEFIATTAPVSASTGTIKRFELRYFDDGAGDLKIGDFLVENGVRQPIDYYPGPVLFNYSPDNSYNTSGSGATYQGPMYIGYQNPIVFNGVDEGKVGNILDLLSDAQTAYTNQSINSIAGPFSPVFYINTWDSEQSGTPGTFGWNGPDPNTFWGGFQYRAFVSASAYWKAAIDPVNKAKAQTICNPFLAWLYSWLHDNSEQTSIPTTFDPLLDPNVGYQEPHMIALALKGCINCAYAGADATQSSYCINRLYDMLLGHQLLSGAMRGSFSSDPDNFTFYGFWTAEILDCLSEVILYRRG